MTCSVYISSWGQPLIPTLYREGKNSPQVIYEVRGNKHTRAECKALFSNLEAETHTECMSTKINSNERDICSPLGTTSAELERDSLACSTGERMKIQP